MIISACMIRALTVALAVAGGNVSADDRSDVILAGGFRAAK